MPIYEYESLDSKNNCPKCAAGFETIQRVDDKPLTACPDCGMPVRKLISWCRAAVVEVSAEVASTERKIGEYEKQGMWSHAAELADKHAERTGNSKTKTRALDNYKKAGYDAHTLDKHSQSNNS